jgi:16S rRNA (guanine527-N7)-methyltransferase
MHPTRIAELLEPFLQSPFTPHSKLTASCHSEALSPPHSDVLNSCHSEALNSCHSESGQRPGEEPAVLPATNDQRLTTTDLDRISTYIDILLRWNARINLTAIRDPEDIVTRHFGESLFAARHLFPTRSPEEHRGRAALQSLPRACRGDRVQGQEETGALAPEGVATNQHPTPNDRLTLADLGSGAGFPGLPIKLWAPHISLTLIESNHKKAAFLREVIRALTLTDVDIQNARAETLTTTFDAVTLRAVERFDATLPTAASLLAPAGRLALLISAAQHDQARSTLPHLVWSPPVSIPQSRSRILLLADHADQEPGA